MPTKSSMISATQDFVDDMIEFSTKSMEWCSSESERAARSVGETVNFLMSDAKRISIMSKEAVALLAEFRTKTADKVTPGKTTDLIRDLKAMCDEEQEIHKFADPVIEALQFQDRISQMMDNMVRMIATWALTRTSLASGEDLLSDDVRTEFGKQLLECTTMPSERNIVRDAIPGLPAEEKTEDVQLF